MSNVISNAKDRVSEKNVNVSLEDTVLSVAFAIFGLAMFLPDTSMTLYGFAVSDYGVIGSIGALLAGYATNDTSKEIGEMDNVELGAVAGTLGVIIGVEHVTYINDLVFNTHPIAPFAALGVTMFGWFVVAYK